MKQTFQIDINGKIHEIKCDPDRTLIDVLREDLRLTGTKRGCDIGLCGSCTVLIDGKPKRACIIKIKDVAQSTIHESCCHELRVTNTPSPPATQPAGKRPSPARGEVNDVVTLSRVTCHDLHQSQVTTIEGLSQNGQLHPIQQAFIDCGAIQCGFCTPGMVLSAKALLDKNPNPTREEIKKALAANLCRCTGYQQIFEAIEEAAEIIRKNHSI